LTAVNDVVILLTVVNGTKSTGGELDLILNKEELKKLLYEKFNGNYTQMAKELRVNVAQLYRILEKESNAGAKFLGKLMFWCKQNGVDFNKYIFLPQPLTTVNKR
jgi:hypothetical protein